MDPLVAYFSMEIGISPDIPTYSGGLGILAGDTIRSAADMKIPMVAVTLVHRKGYFYQKLDENGWQSEEPFFWKVEQHLKEMEPRVSVEIENREVYLRAWSYEVTGVTGHKVPIIFLDSDVPENTEADRTFTHYLYGGDARYRLCQEIILGIGGVRMLGALGFNAVKRFHMNEGHAGFLTLELLREYSDEEGKLKLAAEDIEAVKEKCVFTTHTPIPAGHDQFPIDLVHRTLGRSYIGNLESLCGNGNSLNMTYLALNASHYVNGVAKKHGEISRQMFTGYEVDAITNGVHINTWASRPFQDLFDRFVPGWREDNHCLRYALSIPRDEIWRAHEERKAELLDLVKDQTGEAWDQDWLTLGFARRATAYKRADLLFHNVDRLREIVSKFKGLQLVFAGKAHPHDHPGKELIQKIHQAKGALDHTIRICYLRNYDMALAKVLISGVDVWLNTPIPPLEASGTSGMKAALNGVPSLSILDGWWIEGCIEGVTGWAIGEMGQQNQSSHQNEQDAEFLYDKLQSIVMPLYYRKKKRFKEMMAHTIALNASFFNTHRMMQEYVVKAYFL